MQVIVDGLVTSYQRVGAGRVVILLHGWGDRAAGLRVITAALSKHFDVVVPDLPGFGSSQAPDAAWGVSEYASFVSSFLQKLDAKVYAIVGHSNGGAIAMRGLASGILHADRLVLLASSGIRGEYQGRKRVLSYVAKGGKILAAPLPARAKRLLRQKIYQAVGSDMLVAEHLQESFKRIVTDDLRTDAVKITVPTLLIYGTSDTATPLRHGELLHQLIAGSKFIPLANAGHFVHLDQPTETTHLIEEFL